MSKINILFEKWKDPYGENIEDVEFPGFNRVKKQEKQQAYADSYIEKEDEEEQEQKDVDVFPRAPLRFMITSMGPVPLTEYTQPSKVFNFWVGHTNFDITEDIFDTIEGVDGVELLDIFTRYRFRVGIGKMYKDASVLRDIRKAVLKYVKQNK